MGLGAAHVRLDARDLGPERGDPRVELVDRHRIEVLLGKLDQRIARFAREKFVQIHGGLVDP